MKEYHIKQRRLNRNDFFTLLMFSTCQDSLSHLLPVHPFSTHWKRKQHAQICLKLQDESLSTRLITELINYCNDFLIANQIVGYFYHHYLYKELMNHVDFRVPGKHLKKVETKAKVCSSIAFFTRNFYICCYTAFSRLSMMKVQ